MSDARLVRTPAARVWRRGDTLTVMTARGRALRFDGASADLAEVTLLHLAVPDTRAGLLAEIAARTGAPLDDTRVVDALITTLRDAGALATAAGDRSVANDLDGRRVVLCISGAVAAAYAPLLATLCLRERWQLRLAATRNALRFVSRTALEAITHATVHASHWGGNGGARVPHIELAAWAELVLVAPASATTLSRIARGDCSDVVSATAIATRAPVVLAPSMNAAMYASPSVQRNLQQLRDDGFTLVLPGAGVEVAEAPTERVPMAGPAPMPDDLVAIARAVLAEVTPRATLPADAAAWEVLYRSHTPSTLPWHVDTLEPELAAALLPLAREGVAALDLGTGTGVVARYLARLGCSVTATDVSTTALAAARAMDGGDAVTWRVDDVTQSTLTGPYGLVVDRACLHTLPRAVHARWAETLRRVAPGATLVALVHDARECNAATQGYDEAGLRALLDTCCEAVRVMPMTMRGAQTRRAWLATGRVRAG